MMIKVPVFQSNVRQYTNHMHIWLQRVTDEAETDGTEEV